jgi:hypothetical protein
VELVVEGLRGGQRAALSTASGPVRGTRIVHKSTAFFSAAGACPPVTFALAVATAAKGMRTDAMADARGLQIRRLWWPAWPR